MNSVFKLKTIDDLHRIIILQQHMRQRAATELDNLISEFITVENQHDEENLAAQSIPKETGLLRKWAASPTFTELESMPTLSSNHGTGATFAVAALAGELLMSKVRAMAPDFARAHMVFLMLMLSELHEPAVDVSELPDVFRKTLTINPEGQPSPKDEAAVMQSLCTVIEALLNVLVVHDLLEKEKKGYRTTSLGVRVMLHLFDAQRVIDAIVHAHQALQTERMRVSSDTPTTDSIKHGGV
jgi:hypothetical protein